MGLLERMAFILVCVNHAVSPGGASVATCGIVTCNFAVNSGGENKTPLTERTVVG